MIIAVRSAVVTMHPKHQATYGVILDRHLPISCLYSTVILEAS